MTDATRALGPWVRCPFPRLAARHRVVCFPHAGGGASFYRGWARRLPDHVEHWTIQYPGRENRIGEPPAHTLTGLADEVVDALAPELDRPVTLFGHSMGATVAYEVAQRLELSHPGLDLHLMVSSRTAPHRQVPSDVHSCSDDELMATIAALGGTAPGVLRDPALRDFVLPIVRHDYRLVETYGPGHHPPLRTDVTALVGRSDPSISPAEMAAWADTTTGSFRLHDFDGGHFYLADREVDVVTKVLVAVSRAPRPPR